jgi:hypothetical protein
MLGNRFVRLLYMGAVVLAFGPQTVAGQQQTAGPRRCQPQGAVTALPELSEASGIAVSRRAPGRLWIHNDSGQAILFALDTRGAVTRRVRLTGAVIEDWEAIAAGPCAGGTCLYIADIGDNNQSRRRIAVYRVPEPADGVDSVAITEVFHATYPDGPHDAETLLVTPQGGLFIVTKGDPGGGALYKFPRELKPGATHPLERIGEPRAAGKPERRERFTDGAVSPDGAWVVLRTNERLAFYRSREVLEGNWRGEQNVDLSPFGETQGEGVAFAADGSLYLAGEGGGNSRPGTLARLTCTLGS